MAELNFERVPHAEANALEDSSLYGRLSTVQTQ